MGLDQSLYATHEDNEVYDSETKSYITYLLRGEEIAYWRKNYPLMEWMEKNLELTLRDCAYYILLPEHIKKLNEECREVLYAYHKNAHKVSKEVKNIFLKYFPQNNWNKTETYFDEKAEKLITIKHKISDVDMDHLENIVDGLESHLRWNPNEKTIFYPNW